MKDLNFLNVLAFPNSFSVKKVDIFSKIFQIDSKYPAWSCRKLLENEEPFKYCPLMKMLSYLIYTMRLCIRILAYTNYKTNKKVIIGSWLLLAQ